MLTQHVFAATFGSGNPDGDRRALLAMSYEDAKAEALEIAQEAGISPELIRIFYRMTVVMDSRWIPVNDETDYEEVTTEAYNDLITKNPRVSS